MIPTKDILYPREHLVMSGNNFGHQNSGCGEATGISWVEAKEAVKDPAMHRTAPSPNIELSSPKWQFCQGLETLFESI